MNGSSYDLAEREDGFQYDLHMKCDCGAVSSLTQSAYVEGESRARMPCATCGEEIHYGPAVAAIRDEDDAALGSSDLNSFAWYHTSTQPDWPSQKYAEQFAEDVRWTDRPFGPTRESFIASQTSKALHVGTYEAAIENMLRRMDDQDDGASQFYLYRVALRLDSNLLNPGFRDENHEVASDISVHELDEGDLSAVRYLNVREAVGTLSLAIRPRSVAAVQRIAIPLPDLSADIDASAIAAALEETKTVVLERADSVARLGLNLREVNAMALGLRSDRGGVAKKHKAIERRYYAQWRELEEALADRCLPNVGALVRRNFIDAIMQRRTDDVDAFVTQYRSYAALLAHSDLVRARLVTTPWRVVTSGA
ncbi:hypothetical protein FIV50_12755 [Microbacterium foliorum]|uniref:Uncharacterized protein n=1 Tax=Microbacterium foliorum TaxID=104336 RepID=A0A4Y5YSK0_9MICO|nr:hypothetical protein [Microbacterium foliorum]QDE35578.1 hypothetical protein FIV50_12755 [Microbacterium foliorum]